MFSNGSTGCIYHVLLAFAAGKTCNRAHWNVSCDSECVYSYALPIARRARYGAVWVLSPEDERAYSVTTRGHCRAVCQFFGLRPTPEQPKPPRERRKSPSRARQTLPFFPNARHFYPY